MKTVRGAITAENTEKDIAEKTRTLLTEIMKRNSLSVSDAEAIIFSTTADLTASYPAKAARLAGFSGTSLFSVLEPPIEGSLPKCIRVLVFLKEGRCEDSCGKARDKISRYGRDVPCGSPLYAE